MTAKRQIVRTQFCLIGSMAIAGIGVLAAGAQQQRGTRPYIPRASDVRPISGSQPPALPPPSASSKMPSTDAPSAARPDSAKPKQGGLDMEDATWDNTGDNGTGRDVRYTEKDMVVTGARAKYKRFSKNSGLLNAEGNLVMDDSKYHITGDKGSYDSRPNAKIVVITGSVVIVIKPKDKYDDPNASDVESEKSKGGTIYCDRVDYYRIRKFAVLTGHLVFKQKIQKEDGRTVERTVTAEHAEHDGKADKLHLFAPVDMKDTEDQEGHFDKDVFMGTKEGAETLQSSGHSKFIINVDSDEDEKNGSAPDKSGDASKRVEITGKDTPGTGKQDTPGTTPDKKQDQPVAAPDKKQDTQGKKS